MFIEKTAGNHHSKGRIEVITGPMFSGKTEELIRRLKRAMIAKQRVMVFKPDVDTRYEKNYIVSHDSNFSRAEICKRADEITSLSQEAEVVGIDEAQFFSDDLVSSVNTMANSNKRVIVSGLDMDFKGRPFGPMPLLMAIADDVIKLSAVCLQCGGQAIYSHRLSKNEKKILIGQQDLYESLCRNCFIAQTHQQ